MAGRHGHAIVQALLDAGADPLFPDGQGDSPLALAQQLGLTDLAEQYERNLMERAEQERR